MRWPELATHNILTSSSVSLGSSIILSRVLHLVIFKVRAHVICPFQHVFLFSSSFQKASTFHSATIRFHMKCCLTNNCRNSIQMACHCTQVWVVLLVGWRKFSTIPKDYPDLGSDTSSMWNLFLFSFLRCHFAGIKTSSGFTTCWLFSQDSISVSSAICFWRM